MANACKLFAEPGALSGELYARYQDESMTEKFWVTLDTPTRNIVSVANAARAANPSQFPLKGQSWPANPGYGLFAKKFSFRNLSELGSKWEVTVTYLPLEAGEPNTDGTNDNPLLWPPVYGLDWVEYERPVTKARNVEVFGSKSKAGERAALTLGPVVNSALQEFDEGLFVATRDAVLVISKNVASLDQILQLERDYTRTTNSDTVYGVGPRRYKYLGVESTGQQTANGINYYTRTVRVQLMKTTDEVINNRGWNWWDKPGSVSTLRPFVVKQEGDDAEVLPSEPQFLALDGGKSDTPTTITYRHLDEVPYASLLI